MVVQSFILANILSTIVGVILLLVIGGIALLVKSRLNLDVIELKLIITNIITSTILNGQLEVKDWLLYIDLLNRDPEFLKGYKLVGAHDIPDTGSLAGRILAESLSEFGYNYSLPSAMISTAEFVKVIKSAIA